MEQGETDARRNFRLATTLVDDDIDTKLLNEVRYFLCWLYWESEDYYQSAVLGEFLARRYPDHPAASAAAKLSMASFERLYQQAAVAGADQKATEFEARRMARDGRVHHPPLARQQRCRRRLRRVGQLRHPLRQHRRSPKAARASLRFVAAAARAAVGNAMWGRYLEHMQSDAAARPDEATLNQLKESAVKFLATDSTTPATTAP